MWNLEIKKKPKNQFAKIENVVNIIKLVLMENVE